MFSPLSKTLTTKGGFGSEIARTVSLNTTLQWALKYPIVLEAVIDFQTCLVCVKTVYKPQYICRARVELLVTGLSNTKTKSAFILGLK